MLPLAGEPRAAKASGSGRTGDGLLARAPKLRESADRIVAAIVKGLQVMAGPVTTIEGMAAGFALERAKIVVAAQKVGTVVGAIELADLGTTVIAALDPILLHAMVELLCGGNGAEPARATPRAATSIDVQFAQTVFNLAAAAMQSECAELGLGKARAVKVELPVAASVFGQAIEEVGTVDLTIEVFGLKGMLRLALPPKALAPFAEASPAPLATQTSDSGWSSRLRREIERAPVALAAYLDARDIPLGALAGLKAGQILALPPDARARATLVSEGRVLFRGEIGQEDDCFSLRIGEVVAAPENIKLMATRRAPYFEESKA